MRLHRTAFALDRASTNCVLYAIIQATIYDPNLIFFSAQTFGRFCSCANYEKAFIEMFFVEEVTSRVERLFFKFEIRYVSFSSDFEYDV